MGTGEPAFIFLNVHGYPPFNMRKRGVSRADALEALKSNNLIEVIKNKVHVTHKGNILCFALEGTLLSSPHMTAEWESYLKSIGEGKASVKVLY